MHCAYRMALETTAVYIIQEWADNYVISQSNAFVCMQIKRFSKSELYEVTELSKPFIELSIDGIYHRGSWLH